VFYLFGLDDDERSPSRCGCLLHHLLLVIAQDLKSCIKAVLDAGYEGPDHRSRANTLLDTGSPCLPFELRARPVDVELGEGDANKINKFECFLSGIIKLGQARDRRLPF